MSKFNQICVALDLETTGFDPAKDKIIEVAAVKFQGEQVLDTFSTTINPKIEVPYEVLSITKIKQEDMDEAPTFSKIKRQLKEFVGDSPIIGHNIAFDLSFLKSNELDFKNIKYDTWHFASILLPELGTHSLGALTNFLEIEQPEQHRALSDTMATKDLFLYLVNLIAEIDYPILQEINNFLIKAESDLASLFGEILKFADKTKKQMPETVLKGKEKKIKLTLNELRPMLIDSSEKLFPKTLNLREKDIEKAKIILNALLENKKILISNRSGSLAYLLPSIYFSIASSQKTIISVPYFLEKNLKRDLENLENFLPFEFSHSFLSEPEHYLCMRRFENFKNKNNFSESELRFLIKIILWQSKTFEGKQDEINLLAEEKFFWERVNCNLKSCLSPKCIYATNCYFHKSKEQAKKSSIVVVDHKHLLKNTIIPMSQKSIPQARHLVINGAELLSDEGFFVFSEKLGKNNLESFLIKIADYLDQKIVEKIEGSEELKHEVLELANKWDMFWGLLGIFWQANIKRTSGNNLKLDTAILSNLGWQRVKEASQNLNMNLAKFVALLDSWQRKVTLMNISECDLLVDISYFKEEIKKQIDKTEELIISDQKAGNVYWISFKGRGQDIELYKTPIEIGMFFEDRLFAGLSSAVVMAPIISKKQRFSYLKSILHLDNFEEHILETETSKKRQILIMEDFGEPETSQFENKIYDFVKSYVQKEKGNIFLIFSSFDQLKRVYKSLLPFFDDKNEQIFGEGISGGKEKVIYSLKIIKKRFCLFGTAGLIKKLSEQNIKIIDNAVLVRLPFRQTFHPVFIAYSQKLEKGFEEYTLPKAVMDFQTLLGDLSYCLKDKGKIIILDQRILNKDYGALFIESLDDFDVKIKKS